VPRELVASRSARAPFTGATRRISQRWSENFHSLVLDDLGFTALDGVEVYDPLWAAREVDEVARFAGDA
jgi:hypothetical protein